MLAPLLLLGLAIGVWGFWPDIKAFISPEPTGWEEHNE